MQLQGEVHARSLQAVLQRGNPRQHVHRPGAKKGRRLLFFFPPFSANSLVASIFHRGQLLARLLINLTAAAGSSCGSVSLEESKREFVRVAESNTAPTLQAGPLQGGSIKIRLNSNDGWHNLVMLQGNNFKVRASECSLNPRREDPYDRRCVCHIPYANIAMMQ